jgi:hypothetical protein
VTGEVVGGGGPHSAVLSINNPKGDRRIKAEYVMTLKPGSPITRKIDIGALVGRLRNGKYKIRLLLKGCQWWPGEIGFEDGRLPAHLTENYIYLIPPLMLES